VHIEDFGQVLDRPADDHHIYKARYEHIAAFLGYLPPEDLRAFCERLVFCVLAGNTDAHVKNWSIIYPDGRRPRLSPAYDLVASILYEPDGTLALDLAGSRRFDEVSLESFQVLAAVSRRSFDDVSAWVRQMTERVLTAWQEKAADLAYLPDERARIEAHIGRIPLVR
jgi:serine/threonine-protein kinase HipA